MFYQKEGMRHEQKLHALQSADKGAVEPPHAKKSVINPKRFQTSMGLSGMAELRYTNRAAFSLPLV
jgi:hypothetical protein